MKYNKDRADELAEEFMTKTGVDVFSKSRKEEQVFLRTLFYKVLVHYNRMIDQNIADWYKEHGVSKNRSSIFIALKKIDMYYKLNYTFRDVYDMYFNNKARKRIALEKAEMEALNSIKNKRKPLTLKKSKDALDLLIENIEPDKRKEIYDLVSLRVKSWEWKSKDDCQIIEGYSPLQGTF
jgi:hypothetical protein